MVGEARGMDDVEGGDGVNVLIGRGAGAGACRDSEEVEGKSKGMEGEEVGTSRESGEGFAIFADLFLFLSDVLRSVPLRFATANP